MVLPVFPTLAIGVITLVVWCIYNVWQQKQRYPPGPLNLPVISTIRSLSDMMSEKKIWVRITELQQKYGDVFTVFYINQPSVILGSIEVVREALVTKQFDFEGRPESYFNDYFSNGYKNIAFAQATPEWKKMRKIAHATFRRFASGKSLEKYIHQSFEKVAFECDKVADSGEKVNPKHNLDMAVYNVIMLMVLGKTFEHNDPFMTNFIRLLDAMNDAFTEGLLADFIPGFKYIPTKGLTLFRESIDVMIKMVKDIYEEHKTNFDEDNVRDVVDHMLLIVRNVEKEEGKDATIGLTEEHYQMIIFDIFEAGTDTSRFTLSWAVLYMAAFPECQKKLQEEVDSVIGCEVAVEEDHRSQLTYTRAFLYEVMRIKPIAPLSIGHMTTCDTSVGGYKIPAGTQVFPNIWAIHMNKEAWGDPETFRPERFLDDNGQMGPHNSNWMPFSTGTRVCIGEALAKAELHMLLAAFVQRYEFHAPKGKMMDIRIKPGQVMMADDYEVLIHKRI